MKINDILTLYDKILIGFVIILSLILLLIPFYYFGSPAEGEELILKVQQGDELIKTVAVADSFEQPIVFQIEGPIGIHTIEVNQGRVRVQEAPANDPLKICEKTGWIDREGPIIVCVPNSLSLWLESTNSDIDGMSW
ncbi:NusG domain II-containing protein [Halanaerobium saccharolyticum]|uniref:NusG domain II-containing protein n=1 Tax=Halanaerobium saccharolyticum TaxID=43595 RepID=UPI003FCC4E56